MKLQVFFSPADVRSVQAATHDVYTVVDVIRATTSITAIFDSGATHVFAADTVEQVQRAAQRTSNRLLCGERHARPLPGFDFGNSPAQFARTDLRGRDLILTTTNGSRAFFACPEQSTRLAGCFYNARAVVQAAIAYASALQSNIAIVCAAEGNYFALDDSACAGYLTLEVQRQQPDIELHESVLAAQALSAAYPPSRLAQFTNSARSVVAAGLSEDIDLCMRIDASTSVGIVTGYEQETGLLILERLVNAQD